MKILVLSFYFEPDLCAGSFRNTAIVQTLSKKLSAEDEVEVLTTAPNRYQSFSANAPEYESKGNVRIRRISLPTHQSGVIDQARVFVSYALSVLRITKNQS